MPSVASVARRITREVARSVRHAPGIRSLRVWDALRPHYYRFLNAGHGIEVQVGGRVAIPMPADLTTTDWGKFEPATVSAFTDWVERHPTGVVLDLGSSVGVYSAIALAASPVSEVFAFDGDAIGLRVSEAIATRLQARARFHCCYALVVAEPGGRTLYSLEQQSTAVLDRLPLEPPSTGSAFVNLGSAAAAEVPRVSIDELFPGWTDQRPVLLKIDIEGAELLALRGAETFIARHRPTICLSVHTWLLGQYGGSEAELRGFLARQGYNVRLIEKDWEEHWWCEPC